MKRELSSTPLVSWAQQDWKRQRQKSLTACNIPILSDFQYWKRLQFALRCIALSIFVSIVCAAISCNLIILENNNGVGFFFHRPGPRAATHASTSIFQYALPCDKTLRRTTFSRFGSTRYDCSTCSCKSAHSAKRRNSGLTVIPIGKILLRSLRRRGWSKRTLPVHES